jgi:hypothetical protein
MAWKDGRLMSAEVRTDKGGRARVRYGTRTRELVLRPGDVFTWDGK